MIAGLKYHPHSSIIWRRQQQLQLISTRPTTVLSYYDNRHLVDLYDNDAQQVSFKPVRAAPCVDKSYS